MLLIKIRTYFRLARLHSAVLTSLAPVCTAAAAGISLTIYHYLELFLIGFLFHIYLFVLNEVCDVEIDKTSHDLTGKPLVDGSIPLKNAKLIVFSSAVLLFILTLVFFIEKAPVLIAICAIALVFGGLYDYFGKRFPHADYFISLMIFFVALYGGFSVSNDLSIFVFIIALLALFQTLINNITAGLKDVDHDYFKGGLSTPLRLGVRVDKERFIVSNGFIAYITVLKITHISLTITPFVFNLMSFKFWQLYIVIILIFIAVFFLAKFLTIEKFNREKIMRAIGFHEMFSFMVIPFILFGYIGYEATILLLFLPVTWLGIFLIFIYGKLMPEI